MSGSTERRRRIGIYGICRDEAGRVLLARQAPDSLGSGSWGLPGGGVSHGEDPFHALVREFREETGLMIVVDRVRDVRTDFIPDPRRGRIIHLDRIICEVTAVGGELRPEAGGSTDRVAWMTPGLLAAEPVVPWTAEILGLPAGLTHRPVVTAEQIAAAQPPPGHGVTHVQRFAAYGLASDPAGRLLLTRIAPGYPGGGTWHLPGGGTDFGESAVTGLARELIEETGQVGTVGELLSIEHFHNPAALGPERRPIDWHTVRSVFRVTVPEPTDPVVHDQGGSTDAVAWFTRTEVNDLDLNKLARGSISAYGR